MIHLRSDHRLYLGERPYTSGEDAHPRKHCRGETGDRRHDAAQGPFPGTVISWIDPVRNLALYRQRWEVETLFVLLKSRGLGLEATHLTAPDRIQRLIGLLAVAFAWSHLVGEKCSKTASPLSRKIHGRWRRSLFRYGLDRSLGILTTLEQQREAFGECLEAFRSPMFFPAPRMQAPAC